MNNEFSGRQNMSTRKQQRGVVLFVALIVLVAMSLAGVSMMRAADAGVQIAGNLATRQSAIQAAERAFEQAMQNVTTITSSGANTSDNAALCFKNLYLPTNTPSELPWATASCDLGIDSATGNRVQLLINRLANSQNTAGTRVAAGTSVGNSKKCAGGGCGPSSVYQHYRIVARISDARNMVTYIEEKVY